jgi:serine/threonine-protein kinase RsbW
MSGVDTAYAGSRCNEGVPASQFARPLNRAAGQPLRRTQKLRKMPFGESIAQPAPRSRRASPFGRLRPRVRLSSRSAEPRARPAVNPPEELFTNAVTHGYDGAVALGRIEVALGFDAGRLKIEFSDNSRPFDPLSAVLPDPLQPVTSRPIGGLGLHIVRSLVDDVRYSRDGDCNHLMLIRNIARPERNEENG